jgi:starvation-inducible DNA-binding protein
MNLKNLQENRAHEATGFSGPSLESKTASQADISSPRLHISRHHNYISPDYSPEVAKALTQILAANYDLYHQTLYCHWNVTGPNFAGLHALFEKQYVELQEAGDEIAERIRALGERVPGGMKSFVAISPLPDEDVIPQTAKAMIATLLEGHVHCATEAKRIIEIAEENNDPVTADLMVGRVAVHEKNAWMLRSLLME